VGPSVSTDAVAAPDLGLVAAVDRLVDRAPRPADLRAHGLELWAVRRLLAEGQPLPPALAEAERAAAVRALALPRLLERVRDACDAPILVLKGPEAAAYYPDPALRQFNDLDILVADPQRAHRALRAAGFRETGEPEELVPAHHLRPLTWAGLPRWIEVHGRLKWPGGAPPPTAELFELAQPAACCPLDGVLGLRPEHHALTLAAHSWAHEQPLAKISQLIDVTTSLGGFESPEAAATARRWGLERIWRATLAAARALLDGAPTPASLRLWARNMPAVRERTVLEYDLARLLAPFWALPQRRAVGAVGSLLAAELRPHRYETWRTKIWRTRRALGRLGVPKHEHDLALQDELLAALREADRTRGAG